MRSVIIFAANEDFLTAARTSACLNIGALDDGVPVQEYEGYFIGTEIAQRAKSGTNVANIEFGTRMLCIFSSSRLLG